MHQIRYFLAVARTLNFTRAAEECNVTQPSLTRAIQKLEEEFGGVLFHRERALTHLSELGRMVLPHLEQTYDAAQAASSLAGSIGRAEVAPLSLGLADEIYPQPLNDILSALRDAMPGFRLTLRSGTAETLIVEALKGDLDLVVVPLSEEMPERLDVWPLFDMRYSIASLAGQNGPLTLEGLAAGPWVMGPGAASQKLWAAAQARGLSPQMTHVTDTVSQMLKLVALGMGRAAMSRAEHGDTIVWQDIADCDLSDVYVLASVSGRRRGPAADAFIKAARACEWRAA